MTLKVVPFGEVRLADGRSPEQISRHMKDEGKPSVSHEAIYWHVWLDKGNGAVRCTDFCGIRPSLISGFRQSLLVAKKLQTAPETPTINSASATLSIESSFPCLASLDA